MARAVTPVTLVTAFGLLALGVESFWLVFILGFGVVLPMAASRSTQNRRRGSADTANRQESAETALETLQERYARGELTHEEFEQRVDGLLETDRRTDR